MLAQKGIAYASARSRAATQATEPKRVPRPIPLDIGNGPNAASFFQTSASSAAGSSGVGAEGAEVARRKFRSIGNDSVFNRFGEPIVKVIIYSTAVSLAVHLLYHQLALEEYRITTAKKVAELEAEIAAIKDQQISNSVQHSLGGRREFV
ncbi:hypothetical protein EDD11_003709 [Mortierella claussenii]|nr:hypothetical protein EDD11_003709 [Mortierella claussenii]